MAEGAETPTLPVRAEPAHGPDLRRSPAWRTLVRRPVSRACARESVYLLVAFATGVAGFTFVVAAVATAASLSMLIVGVPMAVLVAHADRWWCQRERGRVALVLGTRIPARYASPSGDGPIVRWLSILRDRQVWLDAVWMLVSLPLGILGFTVVVTVWSAVAGLLSAPIWGWSIPGWLHRHVVAASILAPFLAVPAAVLGSWLIRGTALLHTAAASALLGPGRAALQQRVQALSETRSGAVEAAVTELQRVERDLHDGAQARLVALAMDLGLAEQRLARADPDSAREHLASARAQAQEAMAELRRLVRGIGPSILQDRGLDAALTALVAGGEPPVRLRVELPERPAGARETAAYFVVAEALTNARRHAAASSISVSASEDASRRLVVEVVDDGRGGADQQAGSGLSGLRKRVAALDGSFTVSSPPGGPTVVRAEFPEG